MASPMVGTSGILARRFALVIASALASNKKIRRMREFQHPLPVRRRGFTRRGADENLPQEKLFAGQRVHSVLRHRSQKKPPARAGGLRLQ
jgi:hypothetical protein